MDDYLPPPSDSSAGKQEYLSRRERRLQMRAQGKGSSPASRRLLLWGGGIALVLLVGWGMVRLSANVIVPSGDGTLVDAVTDQDHSKGPRDARVTLVEYSDFQCPACKAFQPVIDQALKDPQLVDKVRFVYRSFPLSNIHPNAALAAQAAEAAAKQGKFWEMHDALFEFQNSWSGLSSKGAREAFIGYATTVGLDVAAFSSDIDSSASKDAVREQAATGTRAGVNSTPTFYINGVKMPQPRNYEEFRQFIIDAVNANP